MLISKNIRNILIIVILFLLLFLIKEWLRTKIITLLGGYTDKQTEIVIDTEYIKGKIDTLAIFNHYVKTNGVILNPTPRIVTKEVPGTKNGGARSFKDFKEFTVNLSDSLLIGEAIILNDFSGDLKDVQFKYKPLFPKYITRVDTVKVTKTVNNTLSNERVKIGAGIGYNNLNHASLLLSYTTKSDWQFIGEYGKSLERIENIQLNNFKTYTIPNKDLISLKIIKNF